MFHDLQVTEIFHSVQGETSLTGLRFGFIRLTGCNLRCIYCDSAYAFKGGRAMSIEEILQIVAAFSVRHILITGGEPLLQRNTPELVKALQAADYEVSIETHGEVSIESVTSARIVMDIKTPGSQMARGNYKKNLSLLKTGDEVKFIITSKEDYDWSKTALKEIPEKIDVLFSPMRAAASSPGASYDFDLQWLAENILKDRLNVRLQTQLHKTIWGSEKTGV